MKYYFDTETSGIFNSWQRDFHNFKRFPAVLSFAGVLVDDEWNVIEEYHQYVKTDPDVQIHPMALAVHGITLEKCAEVGVPLHEVLEAFNEGLKQAKMAVGYNIDFDLGMMELSCYRARANGKQIDRAQLPQVIDLMKYATPICALPPTEKMRAAGRLHNKPANLTEAMKIICGHDHTGAHDALADVRACIMLHRKIREMLEARHV